MLYQGQHSACDLHHFVVKKRSQHTFSDSYLFWLTKMFIYFHNYFGKKCIYQMCSHKNYHIYLAIRQDISSLQWPQITKSVLWNFAIIRVWPSLNNPKYLDPSNVHFWDCFWRKKFHLITVEIRYFLPLILLHSKQPKLHRVLAVLSAVGLKWLLKCSRYDKHFYQVIIV